MKNWAQNKKNPANKGIKQLDLRDYGDMATAFGFITATTAIKQRAIVKKKKEREENA